MVVTKTLSFLTKSFLYSIRQKPNISVKITPVTTILFVGYSENFVNLSCLIMKSMFAAGNNFLPLN